MLKRIIKLLIGIGALGFYDIVLCMIYGIDFKDPWENIWESVTEWAYKD